MGQTKHLLSDISTLCQGIYRCIYKPSHNKITEFLTNMQLLNRFITSHFSIGLLTTKSVDNCDNLEFY